LVAMIINKQSKTVNIPSTISNLCWIISKLHLRANIILEVYLTTISIPFPLSIMIKNPLKRAITLRSLSKKRRRRLGGRKRIIRTR